MKGCWKTLRKYFLSNWSLSEKILLILDVCLFGVLIGWLTSPFRGDRSFLSNNELRFGTHENSFEDFYDDDEEDDEDDED